MLRFAGRAARAKLIKPVAADEAGYVEARDTFAIGNILAAGRRKEQKNRLIDPGGLIMKVRLAAMWIKAASWP
jgi:thymidine phosphorylase